MMSVHSKTIVLFFSLIIGLQSLPRACAFEATDPSADKPGAVTVDGYSRSYTIHIPPNVGQRPPVVFMLHGRGGTKEQAAAEFGWRELADRERFIAVFPQALPIIPDLALDSLTPASVPSWLGSTNFTIWWSSGFASNLPALHHSDDGVFLTRLIAKIVDDEHVDPYRVYIAGSPVVEAWSPTWLHATQKLRELSQRLPRLADYVRRSSLRQFPYFFSRETRTRRPCNRITGHRYRLNKNCPGLVKQAYQPFPRKPSPGLCLTTA